MDTASKNGFSAEQLSRLGGAALLAALPLQVVGYAMHPASEQVRHVLESTYGPSHVVLFVSWILVLLGLPALYARMAARAGRLGLIGFVSMVVTAAYHSYLLLYEGFAVPVMVQYPGSRELLGPGGALAHGAGALGILAGAVLLAFPLFGVATLRSGVFDKGAGWLQIAGVPAFFLAMMAGGIAGGPVGPEAAIWVAGMLPITLLYTLAFAGYAWMGAKLRAPADTSPAAVTSRAVLPA